MKYLLLLLPFAALAGPIPKVKKKDRIQQKVQYLETYFYHLHEPEKFQERFCSKRPHQITKNISKCTILFPGYINYWENLPYVRDIYPKLYFKHLQLSTFLAQLPELRPM